MRDDGGGMMVEWESIYEMCALSCVSPSEGSAWICVDVEKSVRRLEMWM